MKNVNLTNPKILNINIYEEQNILFFQKKNLVQPVKFFFALTDH